MNAANLQRFGSFIKTSKLHPYWSAKEAGWRQFFEN
jgi:hypothetical protein